MNSQEVRALCRRELLEQACKSLLDEFAHDHKADGLTVTVERDMSGDISLDLVATSFGQPVAGEGL